MEFRSLVKNTSYLAGTKMFKFVAGIFRSKLSAIYLGTGGIGIIGQFLMIMDSAAKFTDLGMGEAVSKQISENKSNTDNTEKIAASLKTYLYTIIYFIIISILLLFLFRNLIVKFVFGDQDFLNYYYIAIFTFPILIVSSISISILKGFKGIKYIAAAGIGTIITNLILFIPLIIYYELNGAIIFLPISFIVTFFWNLYFLRKYYLKPLGLSLKKIFSAKTNSSFRKEMLIFSGFGILTSIVETFSSFYGRSLIVNDLGIDKIGIYTPITALSGLFTGFLLPSFHTYLFPRFCEAETNTEVNGILNDALRLGSFYILPLLLIAIPFRELIVPLFYSKSFLEATIYLPYHFLGVVFNVWFVVFTQAMTPRGYIKQHTIYMAISSILAIVLAYLLVPKYGLYGWMLKHVIINVLLFFTYFYFIYKKLGFKIGKSNLILMGYTLLSTLFLILLEKSLHSSGIAMVAGPTLLFSTYWFLTKNEKLVLKSKIKFRKNK